MEMTDKQRRWWFAAHPEYRRRPKGIRKHGPTVHNTPDSGLPASHVSAYSQWMDVLAMHDVHRVKERAIEEHRRKYAIGIEPDPHTFLDVIPYRGFITAPIQTLRSLLWSLVRGGVVSAVNKRTRRWKIGDPPLRPTPKSRIPSWTTQARRTWKNEAARKGADKKWRAQDLERMRKGRPPQRENPETGELESMELHHHPVPRRDGGTEVIMAWPAEHAIMDPHRKLRKRR